MPKNSPLDNLLWIDELLPLDIVMVPKHGGQGYYLDAHLVLILIENNVPEYQHKGVDYPFNLWNGCIFPVEQKKQNAFFLKYVFLENHPANKNWLYIPADSENFEDEVKQMLREITKRNPLLGMPIKGEKPERARIPQEKTAKKKAPKIVKADKKRENAFLLNMVKKPKPQK